MYRLFSLLLMACPLLSFGQASVLTFDEFYQAGGIYPYRAFHDTTNLVQLNGRDVIWDFSSFDLLLIRQHILGLNLFTKETQFLAADVNNTGTITTKDLLDLQKNILGKINFFPGNSGWRFFPTYWLANGFDWKNLGLGHQVVFDPKDFEGRPYEFTAIKVGDVSSIQTN